MIRTHFCLPGNLHSYNYKPDDIYWGQLAGSLESLDGGVTTVVDHAHMIYSADHGEHHRLLVPLLGYRGLTLLSNRCHQRISLIRAADILLLQCDPSCERMV